MQNHNAEQLLEELWKTQEEEYVDITMEQLQTRARRYERENVRTFWFFLIFTPAFVAWGIYDLVRLHSPVLMATSGWLYLTFCYVQWKLFRHGPRRMASSESCVEFLTREYRGKIQVAKGTRTWILLLLPAVLAAWWAGGPALRAKQLGFRAGWLLQPHSVVPLIVTLSVLAVIWLSMGSKERKANREIEKLHQL